MTEAILGRPRLADDVDGLVEALIGFVHRHAEPVELQLAVALADTEIEPSAGEQIQRRRLFGHQHRIVPRQHHHAGAKPDAAGFGGQIGQQRHRGGDLALTGEVMLHHEQLVKAQTFGFQHIIDEALIALAILNAHAALGASAAKQTKLHRRLPCGFPAR